MITKSIAIGLIAASVAGAGHLAVSAATGGDANEAAARSFISPRIDGRRLDVRYSAATPADPAMTARRFCRVNGYDTVVGYSVQPASATRTIGDYELQVGSYGALKAFYAIRCAGAADETAIARL